MSVANCKAVRPKPVSWLDQQQISVATRIQKEIASYRRNLGLIGKSSDENIQSNYDIARNELRDILGFRNLIYPHTFSLLGLDKNMSLQERKHCLKVVTNRSEMDNVGEIGKLIEELNETLQEAAVSRS